MVVFVLFFLCLPNCFKKNIMELTKISEFINIMNHVFEICTYARANKFFSKWTTVALACDNLPL